MMKRISEIENNIDNYLNNDNMYGWFYLDDLQEMANMGRIPKTKYSIHIEGGEGYIPHFHLCINGSGKNVVIRIKLLSNEYFREKDDRMNTLNSSERKALDKYLRRKNFGRTTTIWDSMIDTWNRFNSSHMIDPKTVSQPDYTTLKEPK